jgi:hypothetical protein
MAKSSIKKNMASIAMLVYWRVAHSLFGFPVIFIKKLIGFFIPHHQPTGLGMAWDGMGW